MFSVYSYFLCVSGFVIIKLKIEGQTIRRKPHSYKTQMKIQPYPGLA